MSIRSTHRPVHSRRRKALWTLGRRRAGVRTAAVGLTVVATFAFPNLVSISAAAPVATTTTTTTTTTPTLPTTTATTAGATSTTVPSPPAGATTATTATAGGDRSTSDDRGFQRHRHNHQGNPYDRNRGGNRAGYERVPDASVNHGCASDDPGARFLGQPTGSRAGVYLHHPDQLSVAGHAHHPAVFLHLRFGDGRLLHPRTGE